jgi:hypothetical protein
VLSSITIATVLLSTVVSPEPSPWHNIKAGSEQRVPISLGSSPRDFFVHKQVRTAPTLTESLRRKAERQSKTLRQNLIAGLDRDGVEFEAWPVQTEQGVRTWAFARWRFEGDSNWNWFDARAVSEAIDDFDGIVPETYLAWHKRHASKLFDDFLDRDSLYEKAYFGECIWTNEAGSELYGAWLPLEQNEFYRDLFTTGERNGIRAVCHRLPMLGRFHLSPMSIVIKVSSSGVQYSDSLTWVSDDEFAPPLKQTRTESKIKTLTWPDNFAEAYEHDVKVIAGEIQARYPVSKRRAVFNRKNNADPNNDLHRLVDYLVERYKTLGIETVRQNFEWRGIKQTNLIARIPGWDPNASAAPVLLADHIDTAFSEKTFNSTRKRISVPGADDNATAVAALLRAAEVLNNYKRPRYDILFVHLTGEEFPADSLGARHFVTDLIKNQRDIRALILMDMIGYNTREFRNKFQINAGESAQSYELAKLALNVSDEVAPELTPVYRSRFDERSYLYNTDGIIFSDAGYPVILFNEYINKLEKFNRKYYHELGDTSDTIDWDYATAIVKVAIQTAAQLAEVGE